MQKINKKQMVNMLMVGEANLRKNIEYVNNLNVFPVPDGDTGTNMHMTIKSGVEKMNSSDGNMNEITNDLSKGMLLGARGNSGVILSQFFRGFVKDIDKDEISIENFQIALKSGKESAYSSVIKAIEGTILTVINKMSQYNSNKDTDFLKYLRNVIKVGNEALDNTPELLPILKEAGVIDSGGKGLMLIFEGMELSLSGKEISNERPAEIVHTNNFHINKEDITFGFCTEMLIKLQKEINIEEIRTQLTFYGDSIVAIEDTGILKVHVHTEKPLEVLKYGNQFGEFINIKSDNMRIQAENADNLTHPQKENGIVVVASNKKMAEIFKNIQNIEIVLGGQTTNPSTEDLVCAIKNTHAKNVLILPNNSNIIMAAEASVSMFDDKKIKVLNTKHMTEGLESLINYDANKSLEENYAFLKENLSNIINIEITRATKDTIINNVKIKKNNYLIIKDNNIVAAVEEDKELIQEIIKNLKVKDLDLINVLVGQDGKQVIVKTLQKVVENIDEYIDFEIYKSEQPIYDYLISGIK